MSLLTIAQGLAKNVGIAVPTVVVGETDRTSLEIVQHANEQGEELMRRVDWGALHQSATVTGTGADAALSIAADFDRLIQGVAVRSGFSPVRGLSRAEWGRLEQTEGTPRYYLLENDTLRLWPYLASAATVAVSYISKNWCTGGTAFAADSDTVSFDEALFIKGLIVRWRRQNGMPYEDEEAEYEAALRDLAQSSAGVRP